MKQAQAQVAAVAAMPQPAAKVASLTTAAILTFFNAQADKGETTRLKLLFAAFPGSTVETVKAATKGLTDGLKRGAEGYATAHNRASEIRALFGAVSFGGLKLVEGAGYHAMLMEARNALKSNGIKWTGEKLPTASEKAQAAQRAADVAAYEAALAERDARANKGEDVAGLDVKALAEQHADALIRAKAEKFAGSILKKYGEEFGVALIKALETATGEGAKTRQ